MPPAELTFPDGALPTGMEIAFGADLDGDQDSWPWTNVTPPGDSDFMSQTVSTTRGRQDESSDVAPTAAGVTLDNPDGDYTPDNVESPYWPNVDLGTPARWWIEAPTPRLYLRPVAISSAEVSSSAALNITSDLDVRIDMHVKTMDPSGVPVVIAGRADDGNPYSWRIAVYPDRTVQLLWSATGTTPPLTATSTTPVLPMSARTTLRITIDVNNGAAGRTIKFYTGDSVNGPFTQVGPSVVQAGTTSIANVAEPLVVGTAQDKSVAYAPDADVYAFQLLDGIGGSAIANADFTAQTSGTGGFVDSAGRSWTIFGGSILTDRWYRIVGTVDEWAPVWPWGDLSAQQDGGLGEGEARVDLTIAGILRRLGQGQPALSSPMFRAITANSTVLGYWPMTDPDGSEQIASGLPGGAPATFGGTIDFANDSDMPGSRPLATLTATSTIYGPVSGAYHQQWQTDFYIHATAGPASPTTIMTVSTVISGATTTVFWRVQISAAAVTVNGYDASGTSVITATSAPTDMYGHWTHMRLSVMQNGSNIDMQFEWTPVTYPSIGTHLITASVAGATSDVTNWAVPVSTLLAGISMGHVSVSTVAGGNVAGNAPIGYQGEVAADRMARLCAEEGIDFRVIGAPATTAAMGVQQVATLLTLLDDAENADGGILYEMPDRVGLVYRTRESMYNQPPNMVLDALQNQLQNPFSPILDDQRITNSVTVTRQGGSSYTANDDASIDKRGIYPDTPTLNLAEDIQLQDAAAWLLHRGTVAKMRYPQLATNLGVAPEIIDDWLTVDQGARVHAINLPPQHPKGTVKLVAEGYTEPISPFTWDPVMNCSPASVWDVAVLDSDNSDAAYLLRLETDGSQLAEAIDTTDNSFRVSVTAGPLWVTDAAEFPFDINVAGEQMTVSDIDAVTGGAEFTAAGTAFRGVATVSHVAPSVVAVATGDLLVCSWMSASSAGTYTVPGSMTADPATSGSVSTMRTARETLAGAGATGTRTATFSTTNRYSATSIAIHAGTGSPTVLDYVSGSAAGTIVLTTSIVAQPGNWLLAINGWDFDPGRAMGPPGEGWISVVDTEVGATGIGLTSHTRVWAKRVTVAGIQTATFPLGAGINNNHARLFTIGGLIGLTQLFTVTRSVNGVVKSHGVTTAVTLWNTPVLAR